MSIKKIIITGGVGFIGSHLTEFYLNQGYKVFAIDNMITGSEKNIKAFTQNKNFEFIEHDISNPFKINDDIDYILHFASLASPVDYLNYPIKTLKVGSLGTHNMLGLAKEKNATLLLASTSEVYGDPLIHPQTEEYWGNVNPVGPRGVYDESKRFAESIVLAYHRKHKIDTKIARIFNTYGPRMRLNDGRVVPNFIDQALENKDITIYGDGSQTRSFCYVDDFVKGINKLLLSDYHLPVNLGNPSEMTILNFAKKVLQMIDSNSKIIYQDLPVDDPKVRQPDITKAKEILNWQPEIDLNEGLQKTIEYFRNLKN